MILKGHSGALFSLNTSPKKGILTCLQGVDCVFIIKNFIIAIAKQTYGII